VRVNDDPCTHAFDPLDLDAAQMRQQTFNDPTLKITFSR